MITIRPNGGIGNQLFQYAAGRALSLHHGVDLEADAYHYADAQTTSDRPLMLHRLELPVRWRFYPRRGVNSAWGLKQKIRRRLVEPLLRPIVPDAPVGNGRSFFDAPANAILTGYFQSRRFFGGYFERILREIELRRIASEQVARWEPMLSAGNWCAVQVRRGDYVGNKDFEMQDSSAYYSAAMSLIRKENPDIRFILFSDDPGWCRTQQPFEDVVMHEPVAPAHVADGLFLMTLCSRHIIANSSYGWWGAVLAGRSAGAVVAPKNWFRNRTIEEMDLALPNWRVL